MTENTSAVVAAQQWLLHSGIQDPTTSSAFSGGVRAWFNTTTTTHSFLYSEITGYAITTLVYLYVRTGDPLFLARAKLAAEWLLAEGLAPEGYVRTHGYPDGWRGGIYAFDSGMCLNGLANLSRQTGEARLAGAARSIGDWLLGSVRRSDGGFYSKLDPETLVPFDPGDKWSTISGSFLGKIAIGLLNLAGLVGDPTYEVAAREACEWALTQQQPDGRFPTAPDPAETFLHPHCYAAEGLLTVGNVLGQRSFVEAAANAVRWTASHQLPDGSFPTQYVNGQHMPVSSPDITSQVIRLWLLLPDDLRASCPLDASAALSYVRSQQKAEGTMEVKGGFAAGPGWFYGQPENHSGEHINSWVTMFSLQALSLAEEQDKPFDPFHLV